MLVGGWGGLPAAAQTPGPAELPILSQYIATGLHSNLALAQQHAKNAQATEALHLARALFYPTLDFNARYSRASGGRTIDVPVGTLLNGTYATLNQLTGTDKFPQISDVSTPFLRPREQESKLRLSVPVYQPALHLGAKIAGGQAAVAALDVQRYRRELVKEIKVSYFNYLAAQRVIALYERTQQLVERNRYVSAKLAENGRATTDVVYRARAEVSNVAQQLAEATKNEQVARNYFNFLLNRPQETPIEAPSDSLLTLAEPAPLATLTTTASEGREELRLLQRTVDIAQLSTAQARTRYQPTITGIVDFGYQGTDYNLGARGSRFTQASLVLNWTLFAGFQNKHRVGLAQLAQQQQVSQLQETSARVELEVRRDYYELVAARQSVRAAEAQLSSAAKGFRLVNKQYEQGLSSQLQYIDARTTATNAELNLILSKYAYCAKLATVERSAATFSLPTE